MTNYEQEDQTARHQQLEKYCSRYILRQKGTATTTERKGKTKYDSNLIYCDRKKSLYCHVPKVACTTWTKIMAYFEGFVKSPWQKVLLPQVRLFKLQISS